jgi:hypothetical protein
MLGISVRKIQYKLQEYHTAPKTGAAAVEAEPKAAVRPAS